MTTTRIIRPGVAASLGCACALLSACASPAASRNDAGDAGGLDTVEGGAPDVTEDAPAPHGYALPEFPGGVEFFIRLPPNFSPFLPLTGDEVTREPPGFYDPASSYYFSYGFIWWLTGTPDLSTAGLRGHIRDYYTGLCETTTAAAVTLDEPAAAPPPDAGTLAARRNGTLEVGMCFGMPVPAATVEVSTYACPDHAAVIVLVSGQPSSGQTWTDLRNLRDGFSCW